MIRGWETRDVKEASRSSATATLPSIFAHSSFYQQSYKWSPSYRSHRGLLLSLPLSTLAHLSFFYFILQAGTSCRESSQAGLIQNFILKTRMDFLSLRNTQHDLSNYAGCQKWVSASEHKTKRTEHRGPRTEDWGPGPRFGTKYQTRCVSSCFWPKTWDLRAEVGPMWK